jgi:hypothetical protein
MRADEQRLACTPRAAEHIADAIDRRFEARLLVSTLEPAPRLQVGCAECRPDDTSALRADRAQLMQVGQQTFGIDARHGRIL